MTCPCNEPESLATLEAALAQLVADANGMRAAIAGAPGLCNIPDYPEGSRTEQQACAVLAALQMVLAYMACLQGPANERASCVSAVCSTFSVAWDACFA